ncbi:DUF4134 family protein [Phocaeicola vulgatus]|jgi:hypothetical protein|uniref:DUF4134 family protein n=1 Tax=Phocaeicola vulgatus TaxID=821 RepID=UPI00321A0444
MNFKKIWSTAKAKNSNAAFTVKVAVLTACIKILTPATAFAQDYASGTTALGDVTNELKKYIPIVTNLCYALAGIVAIIGAISVYIAMNNEEQDVKNILVLQNWLERIRKEVTNKVLSIKRISDFLIFPILAQPTLKKI